MSPKQIQLKKGEFLFREGDSSNAMYLIKRGTLSIRKGKEAKTVEVSKVFEREILGEMSFFDRQPRSASAKAISDVIAVEITFDSLDKIYNEIPSYMKTIMAAMAERLRKANEMIRKLQKELGDTDAIQEDEQEESLASALEKILADDSPIVDGDKKE